MFFLQAEDGIRDWSVTGVQTCALPISASPLAILWFFSAACVNCTAFRSKYFRSSSRENASFCGPPCEARSEERRVGKECRSRWSSYLQRKRTEAEGTRDRNADYSARCR